MIFRRGGHLRRNIRFVYQDKEIEIINKFTYLGVVFTTGGSFNTTFETLAGQALKAVYKLDSDLTRFPGISVSHCLSLFDKLVYPVLSYGCEVWGLHDSIKVERVHLKFCKHLLGVRTQTQNNFVYGEFGRTPLYTRRVVSVIKYWLKILHCDSIKYVKVVYNVMYRDLERLPNSKSWAKSVRDVLQSLGFYDVWLFQTVGDVDMFICILKQRLHDVYVQNWFSEISNSTRANTYVLFADFKLQP